VPRGFGARSRMGLRGHPNKRTLTIKNGAATRAGAPRPFFFALVASAFDQAHDKQQDHRANDGIDDLGDEPAADIESNAR
jgi:hypothetical protein